MVLGPSGTVSMTLGAFRASFRARSSLSEKESAGGNMDALPTAHLQSQDSSRLTNDTLDSTSTYSSFAISRQ